MLQRVEGSMALGRHIRATTSISYLTGDQVYPHSAGKHTHHIGGPPLNP